MDVLNNILREIEALSDRVRGHIAAHQGQAANAAAHPEAITGTHPDALAANGAAEAAAVAAQRDDYKPPAAPQGIAPATGVQPAAPAGEPASPPHAGDDAGIDHVADGTAPAVAAGHQHVAID